MGNGFKNIIKYSRYKIHEHVTSKSWAIIIMPIDIKIDNAHGFVHIHFSNKGKHHKISITDYDKILNTIIKHIDENKIIDKYKLCGELK
jgi:hypothetical protein